MAIRVLLIDDSATTRQLLSYILENVSDMELVGQGTNGIEAVKLTKELRPDIVLMDVTMPKMDGLEATRIIMDEKPTPIVIMSADLSSIETNIAFEAISAGALSVLKKPTMTPSLYDNDSVKSFINTLRAMANVQVIRHVRANRPILPPKVDMCVPCALESDMRPKIISIVSSTGGPQTLAEIIKNLPPTFDLPVVIVQHITPDFVVPLVEWLNTLSPLPVHVACEGEAPSPGNIYLAPGSQHLILTKEGHFGFTGIPTNVPHIPSGDVLLSSIASRYGACAIGIVLTGMGADGAQGLRAMYDVGAVTIAQEEASCVIFGMPQEAIALGAARHTLTPSQIAKFLLQYMA